MKTSRKCKQLGFSGVPEVAEVTGRSVRTLHDWANKSPEFFDIVLLGAACKADKISYEVQTIKGIEKDFNYS